ncbi:hypothetical protein HYU93_05220 [Candidatus Daviesbacteria bacterium]|nr:hypothetical protein [Candidatus Daviesbacteria bacterium]
MKKKILLGICSVAGVVAVILILNPTQQKNTLSNPLTAQLQKPKEAVPSENLKEYQDPSGFSFNYPDNLSIVKNDLEDNSTYADLQLTSKEISGSLSIKIVDSKFKTLDDWLKLNQGAATQKPKEVTLGNLKASEIKLSDRLLLGALDQGILFTIEMPLLEEEFWLKVYNKLLEGFTFALPETTTQDTDNSDVSFEGEEVVE